MAESDREQDRQADKTGEDARDTASLSDRELGDVAGGSQFPPDPFGRRYGGAPTEKIERFVP